ncbi:MAG: 50S ribosomal protein L11 methyltransferase [Syntrophaceae bacterium]|nr:50S ribosomal protein L11 methyltransferase [Syntrophaceae bacterium]
MRVGVVRTVESPCQCAPSVAEGLKALGHEFIFADSEEIELRAPELARECDLVIDHTDTFRRQGLFRPLVRLLLEKAGARVVGSDSRACFLADDKIAAKARLGETGIPVPPGIVIRSLEEKIPEWLTPPLVLKPAFEHMSRGLGLAGSEEEARAVAAGLLQRFKQPILMESFVPGKELAVSLLDGPEGLEVLPPLEWLFEKAGSGVLTEAFKLKDIVGERRDARPADFSPRVHDELKCFARRAFQALGLRDYARFDLRLSPGGTFFFLEANTTPSLEPMEALALSAKWAGLDYPALVERMLSAALRRYGKPQEKEEQKARIDLPTGTVELKVPRAVHFPPSSSIDLARILDIQAGERVLDLGCGTGLLSVAAAKLGARRVVATDLDPRALEATVQNARANGVERQVEVRAGSWYDALDGAAEKEKRFDVILATPPQTPGPHPFGPRYGGWDGTRHLLAAIQDAPRFLEPGRGRLWLLAISLANPSLLFRVLGEHFSEVTVVKKTERRFTPGEYQSMEKGLFDYFLALRASGKSEFTEEGSGEFVFQNLFIRASGVKKR